MDNPAPNSTRPGFNFAALDSIQKHIVDSANYVGLAHADHCGRWLRNNSTFDSPLEAIFYIWWTALVQAGEIHEASVSWQAQAEVEACGHKYRLDFQILPEYQLHRRAVLYGIPVAKIAVELDGHDYHERTKEQVTYRNQRDRDLAAEGWTVLHFSGSELYRDPARCVTEVFECGHRAFNWDWERQILVAEQAAEYQAGLQLVGEADAKE
jgi:very-short-patch-repair endonuclease